MRYYLIELCFRADGTARTAILCETGAVGVEESENTWRTGGLIMFPYDDGVGFGIVRADIPGVRLAILTVRANELGCAIAADVAEVWIAEQRAATILAN